MLQNLRVHPEAKTLINLPEGWEILFLAKLNKMGGFLYVTIISPRDACLTAEQHPHAELGNAAKLVLFTAENIRVYDVRHGHKYIQGGGMVEVDRGSRGARWTTADECGHNEVFGIRIPPSDVLIAL